MNKHTDYFIKMNSGCLGICCDDAMACMLLSRFRSYHSAHTHCSTYKSNDVGIKFSPQLHVMGGKLGGLFSLTSIPAHGGMKNGCAFAKKALECQ